MRSKSLCLLLTAVLVLTMTIAVLPSPADAETDSDAGFTVTDSSGAEVVFDGPAKHVVTLGAGYTDTVIQLGYKSRIVAVDKYSTYGYTGNEDFEGISDEMSLGSIYSGDEVVVGILQLIGDGFLEAGDAVIMPSLSKSTYPGINSLDETIAEYGCKIVRLNADSYDDVTDVVKTIGRILGDEDNKKVQRLEQMRDYVVETVEAAKEQGLADAAGIHISSKSKIYNHSILVSMIDIAGGINAGFNPDYTASNSYNSDGAAVLQMSKVRENTVVFVDSGYAGTAAEFRSENNLDCPVVKMGQLDNNISPSAADALWKVASAMYPEAFGVEPPSFDDQPDHTLTYIAVGAVAAIVLAVGAVVYLRR